MAARIALAPGNDVCNGLGECRVTGTEPIDGLLGVTHPITFLHHIGQGHEYLYLYRRTVLKLVHKQMSVGAAYLRCHILVLKELVQIMLNVAEVNNAFVELVLGILLVPFLCQPEDGLDVFLLQVIHLLAAP